MTTHEHEVRPAVPERKVRRPSSPAADSAAMSPGHLMQLQRSAGNAAVTSMLQRRVAAADGTDPNQGPVAEIADSALSGAQKKAADQALGYIDAGTAKEAQPWAVAKTTANGNKVPGSVKNFKWGVPHGNRGGDLPGTKGAGGYKEYYLRKGDADTDSESPTDRLVISTSTSQVFHTATHYGRDGSPAFTHFR